MEKAIRHWSPLAVAAITLFAGLGGRPAMASTVYVGTCVSHVVTYSTIQSAVTAVSAGSTILVCPGNYPEQVIISKNLTLTGIESGAADAAVLVIPGSGFVPNTSSLTTSSPLAAQILVESPATNVTISYLAVDGTGNNLNYTDNCSDPRLIGFYFRNASGTLNSVVARNQAQDTANFGCQNSAGLGVFIQSSGTPATVKIANSNIHGFQKAGIVANENGTTVTLIGNSVIGAGPVNTAQIGIQIAVGAAGTVQNNILADDLYNGEPSAGLAPGILIYASGHITITGNSITSTQFGIALVTAGDLTADWNTVDGNLVVNTQIGDGIDACSNHNTLIGNTVLSSSESGIHLNSLCGGTGSYNTVGANLVNEACAGILEGGSPNTIYLTNAFLNVVNTTLAGDVCTAPVPGTLLSQQAVSPGNSFVPVRP